jgi:hypothetical protein
MLSSHSNNGSSANKNVKSIGQDIIQLQNYNENGVCPLAQGGVPLPKFVQSNFDFKAMNSSSLHA